MSATPRITSVPTVEKLFGAKTKQLARFCEEPAWTAYNPSICYTEEHGYLVLLRSSNGWLRDHRPEWQTKIGEELSTPDSFEEPGQWYQNAYIDAVLGTEKLFRNRMFIAKLNPATLTLGKIQEVDLTKAYENFHVDLFRGIEDGRLYHDGKNLRISATIYESGKISVARVCNLTLDMSSGTPIAGDIEMFDSPVDAETVEKNWMPIHKTSLIDPNSVDYDYIYNSGETYTIEGRQVNHIGGMELPVRGGSQLIGLENGTMLAVIHQTVFAESYRSANIAEPPIFRRKYIHRFMQYDSEGHILRTTDMFNFLNKSIEFAAGIALHDNKVLVTFGALDSSAHIASIPLKNILSALRVPNVAVLAKPRGLKN